MKLETVGEINRVKPGGVIAKDGVAYIKSYAGQWFSPVSPGGMKNVACVAIAGGKLIHGELESRVFKVGDIVNSTNIARLPDGTLLTRQYPTEASPYRLVVSGNLVSLEDGRAIMGTPKYISENLKYIILYLPDTKE